MFSVSVIIDIAIVAVLLLCILLGRSRGLFRSFMGLAAVVVALILASRAADFGTDLILEKLLRPAATTAMEQRIDEMMMENIISTSPVEEMERVISAIPNDFIREKAGLLLAELQLSTESMPAYSAKDTLLELGGGLLDTVLNTAARGMIHALLYLIAFLAVTLVLKILISAVDITLHLPLLRQVNQFGGLLFGAAEGVVLVCAAVWLLGQASLWVTPENIERSHLLKFVARWMGVTGGAAV